MLLYFVKLKRDALKANKSGADNSERLDDLNREQVERMKKVSFSQRSVAAVLCSYLSGLNTAIIYEFYMYMYWNWQHNFTSLLHQVFGTLIKSLG